ncbi:glycosyltransferase [Sulfitobacter sp. HNIBRBA2951]|uniref:glycosyltransferase family protein n=1 Tax=Sulfitobacter aquimarinus TaxID=3158557 RepID=UPI0032DFF9D2
MRVMIVVTHLLGTGHLARALTLARAFAAAGDAVQVVSGGKPAPLLDRGDVELVQLPPVASDGVDFSRLLDGDGALATDSYLATRQSELLSALHSFAPDILITELFPFGRRILAAEFRAMLQAAKASPAPPLICASIRDILAPPSKPKKAVMAQDILTAFYDAVLVHSDAKLTPLELSWPVDDGLRHMLHYTGFVAPPAAGTHPGATGHGEVIVSAGGGDVGQHVYRAAVEAADRIPHPLRVLVGGADPQMRIAALHARATAPVVIEPARPDFRQMLSHAAASVSLCGYNTALDILQAGTPAIFIPFDEGNEVEQGLRATALSKREGIESLPRATLTPDSLSAAIARVIAAPARMADTIGFDGAARTVEITHKLRGAV